MRGSERHTVIAADVGGQAALFKKPLKHSESVLFPGRRKGFTREQKTSGRRARLPSRDVGPRESPAQILPRSRGQPVPTENPIQRFSPNVTLLHCAQNLPQYQFARDSCRLRSRTGALMRLRAALVVACETLSYWHRQPPTAPLLV